ncbi:MAG: hypothetical protein Q9168_002956 [Polycauliona sp. 1 TL-2023]
MSHFCNLCWTPPGFSELEEGDNDWMHCNADEAGQGIPDPTQSEADTSTELPIPCNLCWTPPGFSELEGGDNDWMYCNADEAGHQSSLEEETPDPTQSEADISTERPSPCNLCWTPPGFSELEGGDNDWMYCSADEAGHHSSPEETPDPTQRESDTSSECPSSCRNPESPLDQVSMLSDPQSLLGLCQGLEKRLARLESSKDELIRSLDQEIEEIRDLLTEVTGTVTGVDVQASSSSPPCDEVFSDSHLIGELESTDITSPDLPREVQEYVEDWHNGGLILIENLSEHTRMTDVQSLFGATGTITYIELHGADKSRPHVNSRYSYVHYAELRQAVIAVQEHHGALLAGRALMVFLLSTNPVRGQPGMPYLGSALEVLNLAGGCNYTAPQPEFRQDHPNGDLQDLLEHLDATAPLQHSAAELSTYSLKSNLTARTAGSWRRIETPLPNADVDAVPIPTTKALDVGLPQQVATAVVTEIKPLLIGQPGAFVPPKTRKRKASSVTAGQPHPVMRVLKRGEPLPVDIFRHGMVDRQDSKSALRAVESSVLKGKQQLYTSQKAAIDEDSDDEEEGGVLL